jgi:hypothetical protein
MKWLFTLLMWVSLAASVLGVRGDDSTNKRTRADEPEKRKEERQNSTAEERESKAKESRKTNNVSSRADWEKRREQLKNMTPEERAAKRKEIQERLEKRIAELRHRQTNGTLSAQETRELERREQILKRFEPEGAGGTRIEHPKPVLTNSPVEK